MGNFALMDSVGVVGVSGLAGRLLERGGGEDWRPKERERLREPSAMGSGDSVFRLRMAREWMGGVALGLLLSGLWEMWRDL